MEAPLLVVEDAMTEVYRAETKSDTAFYTNHSMGELFLRAGEHSLFVLRGDHRIFGSG